MSLKLIVKKGVEAAFVENYLEEKGLAVQAIIESPQGGLEIWVAEGFPYRTLEFIDKVESVPNQIDWEAQWETFSPEFSDGKFRLDLKPYGGKATLLLHPGPGFGDLSHPTTRLALELLKGRVKGKSVVDIGSGSGILSLAAAFLGAREVLGIDIDRQANLHARRNARLNRLQKVKFLLPKSYRGGKVDLFLMNMIFHEQQEAIEPFLSQVKESTWITSGILQKQKTTYERWLKKQGFIIKKMIQEEGWLGYQLEQ